MTKETVSHAEHVSLIGSALREFRDQLSVIRSRKADAATLVELCALWDAKGADPGRQSEALHLLEKLHGMEGANRVLRRIADARADGLL